MKWTGTTRRRKWLKQPVFKLVLEVDYQKVFCSFCGFIKLISDGPSLLGYTLPDDGPSNETWKFSWYFSGSCIINPN